MAWTEETIARCLALWREDLKAMDLGSYTAPLPHPVITDERRVFVRPSKPPRELVHNRSGYARGCRCDVCVFAQRAYMRDWLARRRAMLEAAP